MKQAPGPDGGPPQLPPVRLVSIYAAHVEKLEGQVQLLGDDRRAVLLHPGGFEIEFTRAKREVSARGSAVSPQKLRVAIPPGTYVVIVLFVPWPTNREDGARAEAALEFARLASLFELAHPGVLAQKVYEGPANRKGEMVLWPEHSMRVQSTRPRSVEDLASAAEAGDSALAELAPSTLERYGLAARLLMTATTVESPIDRLLALWTVLEVHMQADTKVVQSVTRFISAETGVSKELVKLRLMVGEIYGFRKDIVHRGMAFVPASDDDKFNRCLARLRAIVLFCLRRMIDLPGGQILDEYLNADASDE